MARYLVNASGVVHSVPDDLFNTHLVVARQTAMQRIKTPDAVADPEMVNVQMPREATPDEIAGFWRAQGLVWLPDSAEAVTPAEAAERAPKAASGKSAAKE